MRIWDEWDAYRKAQAEFLGLDLSKVLRVDDRADGPWLWVTWTATDVLAASRGARPNTTTRSVGQGDVRVETTIMLDDADVAAMVEAIGPRPQDPIERRTNLLNVLLSLPDDALRPGATVTVADSAGKSYTITMGERRASLDS